MSETQKKVKEPRLYGHTISEIFVANFGTKDFSIRFPNGQKAFDWELKEAILSASEDGIITSLNDVDLIVRYVKDNLDSVLLGFNTLDFTIEENNKHLRAVIKNALSSK